MKKEYLVAILFFQKRSEHFEDGLNVPWLVHKVNCCEARREAVLFTKNANISTTCTHAICSVLIKKRRENWIVLFSIQKR